MLSRANFVCFATVVIILNVLCSCDGFSGSPNIVFILTDDQDTAIGGQIPISKTRKLIGDAGINFENMFVTSPLCCPSRSSIITGRYIHNHNAVNNSLSGNCSSPAWQQTHEKTAFPTKLKAKGYTTFYAGKYLNQYGKPGAGGVSHVPPGWDWWMGLVGNSRYYNYSLSVNGKRVKKGDTYPSDYLTDVIHKESRKFLDSRTRLSSPFFMMLATPACHAPFTPAPQYQGNFSEVKAPRNGSYNVKAKGKHWLMEQPIVPMPDSSVQNSDTIYRNRWRTLLSVDDMVADIVDTLDRKHLLDNTYIFYSSDNGYHLGQFGLPYDKRQLYDFDIRVPLMVRGPGIRSGQVSKSIVLNIDFAPTFVELAGADPLDAVDGLSMASLLHPNSSGGKKPWTTNQKPRTTYLVEHRGEYQDVVPGCPKYTNQDMSNCNNLCVCEDSKNNTYACVGVIKGKENYKYCEFEDSVNFVEMYDLNKDPYELRNLVPIDPSLQADLVKKLRHLSTCAGDSCSDVPGF